MQCGQFSAVFADREAFLGTEDVRKSPISSESTGVISTIFEFEIASANLGLALIPE
jgi:hypothetical protein